ncbi:MAG: type II secretion system F family protein, partial [Planctomycetes bacterium]|nr:type II secretion system F family protein [Planctomycetota bacterium]
ISQLSVAMTSGLPLLSALEVILEQEKKEACRDLLTSLIEQVRKGKSLSASMAMHPKEFKPLSCAMVEAGEVGGILHKTTPRLVELLKREQEVRSKIMIALSYPIFVLTIGIISVILIMTFILPNIIEAMGDTILLPWPTRVLLFTGDLFSSYGWVAIPLIVALALSKHYLIDKDRFQFIQDKWLLKTPLLGPMLTSISVGRFARTLGALGQGGITILQSLSIVKNTLDNKVLEHSFTAIERKVTTGTALSQAIKESELFPPLLIQVIAMGEKTGELDILLSNAADTFEKEADSMIERCMNLLPGLLMVILFMIIGFIALAILLPIMGMDMSSTGF